MQSAGKIRIKLESQTSELQLEVKGTERVQNLIKIIRRAWGDKDDQITLHHHGTEMTEEDQPLSAYGVTQGSVIQVKVSADSPGIRSWN